MQAEADSIHTASMVADYPSFCRWTPTAVLLVWKTFEYLVELEQPAPFKERLVTMHSLSRAHVQRPWKDSGCLPLALLVLFPGDWFSHRTSQFGLLARLAGPRVLEICPSLGPSARVIRVQIHIWVFFLGAWDLTLGPHTCAVSTLNHWPISRVFSFVLWIYLHVF